MNSCNKCLYNNDDICQNDKCSFDSEDNCYEFEDIFTYNKGYHQGRIDLLTEFKKQGAYDIIRADEREKVIEEVNALIQTRLIDNLALDNATKYGNKSAKQQANSYATVMKYEMADCVEDLLDDLEKLKEQK